MTTSAVPRAKAALVDVLQAVPELGPTRVFYGLPRDAGGRELVVVGDVEGDQRAATLGRGAASRREERFRILVVVTVVRDSIDTPKATTERAYELAGYVEDAIRATPDLGLTPDTDARGLFFAETTKTDLSESVGDGAQRSSTVTIFVACLSRI